MAVKNFDFKPSDYDLQVDWPARMEKERDFFLGLLRNRRVNSVLDIGCGTGHHAGLFADFAGKVVAIDPDPEMIEYARQEVVKSPVVELVVAGFEDLDKPGWGRYDMVTSLGNTLPIMGNRKKVKLALKNTARVLAPGGFAVFQFLNFDSEMMERNRFYQPKIFSRDGNQYIFIKHFEHGRIKTRVDFIITVTGPDGLKDFFVNASYLATLKKDIFMKMALNAGFKNIDLLGTGGKEPFNPRKHISLYAVMSR